MVVDIIKMVMIKVDDWIRKNVFDDVIMMMQVYDELVFEIKEDKVEIYVFIIIVFMESVVMLNVLLVVEVGVGENWDEVYQFGNQIIVFILKGVLYLLNLVI